MTTAYAECITVIGNKILSLMYKSKKSKDNRSIMMNIAKCFKTDLEKKLRNNDMKNWRVGIFDSDSSGIFCFVVYHKDNICQMINEVVEKEVHSSTKSFLNTIHIPGKLEIKKIEKILNLQLDPVTKLHCQFTFDISDYDDEDIFSTE